MEVCTYVSVCECSCNFCSMLLFYVYDQNDAFVLHLITHNIICAVVSTLSSEVVCQIIAIHRDI